MVILTAAAVLAIRVSQSIVAGRGKQENLLFLNAMTLYSTRTVDLAQNNV